VIPTITADVLRGRLRALAAATGFALSVCAGTSIGQAPPAPRFDIQRYVVEGNSLLQQAEIDGILAPFAGKSRDFGDIQRALEALQDAYTSRGYNAVRVSVPEQDIRAGQVRLRVVEARLRQVRVQGNRFFDAPNVRAGLPSLKEDSSPNTRAIGENAQIVNENPAKQVSVSLQAADDPGKVDATIRVTDEDPSRISTYLDNTGTPKTGNYRLGVGYQHANVFNSDHVLNVQALTSPTHASDVQIFGLGYRVPVYSWSGTVDAFAGYSSVSSGTVQDFFNVSGKGTVLGLRYTQLLRRIDTYEHRVALGLDHRAYDNDVTFGGVSIVPDITVRPVSLTYSGRISHVGQDVSFNLALARNIPGGKNGTDADFDAQRGGAKADYTVTRVGMAFSRLLPADYLVRWTFNAQHTSDLLIPGEQFGMGGVDSVRGYYERETASDIGWRFSIEGYGPDFGSQLGKNWRARALVFYDTARGYDNVPARDPSKPENKLGSAGIGLRAGQGKSLAFRLDAGRVLQDAGTRLKGESRLHFAVAYSF
jgi:hemolysin activation/secretion protein